jgi:FMN-dependent NADH-azoreductase
LQEWVGANFTPADKRTPEQIAKLSVSSALVAEVKEADVIVVAVAVYNLSIPSSLKAWIDLVTPLSQLFFSENIFVMMTDLVGHRW